MFFHINTQVLGKTDFCRGFEHGYVTGYKKASGTSFDPYVPYCPYQPYKNYGDPQSDYEYGYFIGLEKGLNDGSH